MSGVQFNPNMSANYEAPKVQFGGLTTSGRGTGGVAGGAGAQQRSEEMAQIYNYGATRGINAKDTYGLDGSPHPQTELGLGGVFWDYA